MAENIRWEVEGEIGILTIQRPKALNALNFDTMLEIEEVLDKVALDPTIRAVVITGDSKKAFIAGADIANMQNMNAVEGCKWGEL